MENILDLIITFALVFILYFVSSSKYKQSKLLYAVLFVGLTNLMESFSNTQDLSLFRVLSYLACAIISYKISFMNDKRIDNEKKYNDILEKDSIEKEEEKYFYVTKCEDEVGFDGEFIKDNYYMVVKELDDYKMIIQNSDLIDTIVYKCKFSEVLKLKKIKENNKKENFFIFDSIYK